MTSFSDLGVFLHILVMCTCTYFSMASSLDGNKAVLDGLQNLTIDCGMADYTIKITNIHVSVGSIKPSCSSPSCNITEEQKSEIYHLCNNNHACSLATISDILCLKEYGSFNVSYACDYVGHGPFHECSFEDNTLCDWISSSSGKWIVGSAETQNAKNKPDHDHTTKSGRGHYVYTEFNGVHNRTEEFNLYKTIAQSDKSLCISFWYQLVRCRHSDLQIKHTSTSSNSCLWTSSISDTDNAWKYKQISFISNGSNKHIYIFAKRTLSSECIVALDDIILVEGPCREPMSTNEPCKNFDSNDELEIDACAAEYKPSDMSLKYTVFYPDCMDDYNKIRSTSQVAFKQCTNANTGDGECDINIVSVVMNNTKCFLANKLVVDYECIGLNNTHSSLTTVHEQFSTVDVSSSDIDFQNTGSVETQTITTIDQHNYTNNEPLSFTNEHETVYLIVCACIAAIGCIVAFFLIFIKRKGICGKPKNDNGKMGRDVQVIHDPYNLNKTGESIIQLDILYSSPCDTLDESKHRESGPVYAMPSNAYCTANEVKRMDNSNGNPVGGTGFAKSMDIYAESVDGVYDTSGSRRHVEDDDNLSNHSVDSIYDHTQAENNMANDDATYDRTFGNVTERLYDVSRR